MEVNTKNVPRITIELTESESKCLLATISVSYNAHIGILFNRLCEVLYGDIYPISGDKEYEKYIHELTD